MNSEDITLMSGSKLGDLNISPALTVSATEGSCGEVVSGINLADDMSAEVVRSLITLANHSGLLIIPDQKDLEPGRQAEVTEHFGRIFERGSYGDRLPSVSSAPVTIIGADGGVAGHAELYPHSDVQEYPCTPDFSFLHGVEVPPVSAGGSTHFANLYQAYDELSPATRERIDGLKQRPYNTPWTGYQAGVPEIRTQWDEDGFPPPDPEPWPVLHPVVRNHPITGRKALWVTVITDEIVGTADLDETRQLATELKDHACNEHLFCRHDWAPLDVLIWDNRCVNHKRDAWDPS